MAVIYTKRGLEILVDDSDFEHLNKHAWQVDVGRTYAYRKMLVNSKYRNVRMHRYIMGVELCDPRDVDHIDGNRLNNQRSNLRICSHAENMFNYKKPITNKSGFKGVRWDKRDSKWRADIKIEGKSKFLGTFDLPENAHAAYCAAALRLRGEFASVVR